MYNFAIQTTKLHNLYNSYAHITIFHIPLDVFNRKKLHSEDYFLSFFTFRRVKIIDRTTIASNAQG